MGGVNVEPLARVAGQFERLEVKGEVTDERVVQALDSGAVVANIVGGPALPEGIASGRQLADEVLELPVVRVAAGLGTEEGNGVVSGLVEVDEEIRRAGGEEEEPGGVR